MGEESIDLRAVALLVAVAEEGSFGKAALRLHISQPALSVRIRRLEEDLDAVLLTRSPRGVQPTPAGELLIAEGRRMLGSASALRRRVRALAQSTPTTFRLGFLANAAAELTPALVRAFEERAPEIELELCEFHFSDPDLGLLDGRSDAALLRPPVDGAEDYEMIELFAEPRVAVLPVSHPLAGRSEVEAAELLEEPWVTGSHGAFRDFWTLGSHRRSAAPIAVEGQTVAEWWSAVASGRAICVSPASAERYDKRPELAFVPIVDAAPSVCALAWRSGTSQPGLSALIEAAMEVRGGLRP
jgi:DNA-binding transcriptional LysR family regulator